MTKTTNNSMPADFAEAYTLALGSILRFEEARANARLNTTFTLAAKFESTDNVWQSIHADLSDKRTHGLLYGDYNSDSAYPWIRDPEVLATVVRHATMLGEDLTVIENFIERTHRTYGSLPCAAPRLVA